MVLAADVARVREALCPLGLLNSQKRIAWEAWKENPEGTERMALESMGAARPAAAFLARIRAGLHREPVQVPVRYTGWRFVRGTHSGTYVRDPRGLDNPPPGYGSGTLRESSAAERDIGPGALPVAEEWMAAAEGASA